MHTTFADMLVRDAGAVFLAGPGTGFAVSVQNGATVTSGILDTRYFSVENGGFAVQKKRLVLKLKTGEGGVIAIDTELVIAGVTYRVDAIEPVPPDGLFTEYGLAGGAA